MPQGSRRGEFGLPKLRREALATMIALEMLTQGVHFDAHGVRGLPFARNFVTRTFRALIDSGVITRSTRRGKYLLTGGFLDAMKKEITRGMPRGIFVHYPDLAVFDISGIESWTEEELEVYVKELEKRWLLRTGAQRHEGGRRSTRHDE